MHENRKKFLRGAGPRPPALTGILAILFLVACATDTALLNSERIEQRYGSYGIEVRTDADGTRRSLLYSTHDGRRITRTYAVVRLYGLPAGAGDALLEAAHRQILGGASMGATLEASGWQVVKRTRYVGSVGSIVPVPEWAQSMGISTTDRLAVHIYRLWIKKDSEIIEYAEITEVHHPDYLDETDLRNRVPDAPRTGPAPAEITRIEALLGEGD